MDLGGPEANQWPSSVPVPGAPAALLPARGAQVGSPVLGIWALGEIRRWGFIAPDTETHLVLGET